LAFLSSGNTKTVIAV